MRDKDKHERLGKGVALKRVHIHNCFNSVLNKKPFLLSVVPIIRKSFVTKRGSTALSKLVL